MVTCLDILAPGGDIIIASECSEGLGSTEYREAQRRLVQLGTAEFLESILHKSHADVDGADIMFARSCRLRLPWSS